MEETAQAGMETLKKEPVTMQQLKDRLTTFYAPGWETFFEFLGGLLMIVIGIPMVVGIIGLFFIGIGLRLWWGVLQKLLKKNRRIKKIQQNQFCLQARPVWKKEIEPGDSYSDETYWLYLDGDEKVKTQKGEYPYVETGDMVYQLRLEGEKDDVAIFVVKLCEPDEEVKAIVR